MACNECEDAFVIDYLRFHVDECLVERLAIILADQKKDELNELIKDLTDRLEGRCFCSAYSANECLCGAWY